MGDHGGLGVRMGFGWVDGMKKSEGRKETGF